MACNLVYLNFCDTHCQNEPTEDASVPFTDLMNSSDTPQHYTYNISLLLYNEYSPISMALFVFIYHWGRRTEKSRYNPHDGVLRFSHGFPSLRLLAIFNIGFRFLSIFCHLAFWLVWEHLLLERTIGELVHLGLLWFAIFCYTSI